MAYPSVQSMKDALGDIVLLVAYSPTAKVYTSYTFDQLPVDAQVALFLWINQHSA